MNAKMFFLIVNVLLLLDNQKLVIVDLNSDRLINKYWISYPRVHPID